MPKRPQTPDMAKVGVLHPKAKPDCPQCAGRGWAVLVRINAGEYPQYEGKRAVQRCDKCLVYRSDLEAVKRAHQAGVYARFEPPYVLLVDIEPPFEVHYELWHDHPPVPLGEGSPFSLDPDRGSYFHSEGKATVLRWPLTSEQRLVISSRAARGLLCKSDHLAAKLRQSKSRKTREALVTKWEMGFLELLIATWGAWGEGPSQYEAWMRERRKSIAKKYGIYV